MGTLAFSAQIFFDFAGYSTCAIGVALCLGFVLPSNFLFPYAAIGFSDFWRRWHVSLSSWLRDYLYVSLGGNRRGVVRTYVYLMLTMLLGGLWHGASWTFVVWGGLHGVYLIVERVIRRNWGGNTWTERWYMKALLVLLTYFLICIAWVFFRAQDFSTALTLLTTMFLGAPDHLQLGIRSVFMVLIVSVALLVVHWFLREINLETVWGRFPWWVRSVVLMFLLLCLILTPGDDRAFIYFQF